MESRSTGKFQRTNVTKIAQNFVSVTAIVESDSFGTAEYLYLFPDNGPIGLRYGTPNQKLWREKEWPKFKEMWLKTCGPFDGPAPSISLGAEIAIRCLSHIKIGDSSTVIQETLAYARTVLETIDFAEKYESSIYRNFVESVKQVLGESAYVTLEAKLREFGLHISSFIGCSDRSTRDWQQEVCERIREACFPRNVCTICDAQVSSESQNEHLLEFHSKVLDVPKKIPPIGELLGSRLNVLDSLLKNYHAYHLPIAAGSLILPEIWKEPPEIYLRQKTRRMYYESLDFSKSRLLATLHEFYQSPVGRKYDSMQAFANNTSILSKNTHFGNITPKKPPVLHEFQLNYLNRVLQNMLNTVNMKNSLRTNASRQEEDVATTVYREDRSIVIEVSILAQDLGFREDIETSGLITPAAKNYVSKVTEVMSKITGTDINVLLFRYACARSVDYCNASPDNQANRSNILTIAILAILYARQFKKYRKNLDSLPNCVSETYEVLKDNLTEELASYTDKSPSPIVESSTPIIEVAVAESVTSDQFDGYNESFRTMTRPAPLLLPESVSTETVEVEVTSPSLETVSLVGNYSPVAIREPVPQLMYDIFFIMFLANQSVANNEVAINQNYGPVHIDVMRTIAGSGKTTAAKIAACLINKFKSIYANELESIHFELVYVCDNPLVCSEIFKTMEQLGSGLCKVSLATESRDQKILIKSNFKETRKARRGVSAIEFDPEFKCRKRDMFIMSTKILILYILGKNKDTGIDCGNPKAFVFIDEFCARIGDLSSVQSLAIKANFSINVTNSFKNNAQALLMLTNSPSLLTIVGATVVPTPNIENTVALHQYWRPRSITEQVGGKIYVGSQIVMPWGESVNLWDVCPQDLFGDLFIGLKEPLTRRLVGHHSAIQLRRQIYEAIATKKEMNRRLEDMINYLTYDIGTFSGDSVANYTLGLLFFLYQYAYRYISSASLDLLCSDVIEDVDISMKELIPVAAPWPQSYFMRVKESYRVEIDTAPPNFLRQFGIANKWSRTVRKEAVERRRAILSLQTTGTIDKSAIETYFEQNMSMPFPSVFIEKVGKTTVNVVQKTWTIFGSVVDEIKRTIAQARDPARTVTLVMDSDPLEYAIASLAKILGMSFAAFRNLAIETMKTATASQQSGAEKAAQNVANAHKQMARGTTSVETASRGSEDSHVRVAKSDWRDRSMVEQAASIVSLNKNPRTMRDYVEGNDIFEDDPVCAYLLSWDILVIPNGLREFDLCRIFQFIKSKPGRAGIIFLGSYGAYGINIERATQAIVTPRGALKVSTSTLKQYFCRIGREAMSDDADLKMDLVTVVRLLEESIHTTNSILFPNVYISLRDHAEKDIWCQEVDARCKSAAEASAKLLASKINGIKEIYPNITITNWHQVVTDPIHLSELSKIEAKQVNECDDITRNAFVSLLTNNIITLGNSNRDAQILSFFVGAVQHHIHEPFGYRKEACEPIWPRRLDGGSDTILLHETLLEVSKIFSQARDQFGYMLFEKFTTIRSADGVTNASDLIEKVAKETNGSIASRT